jgi:membrane-bound lytic murein transglycosylase D
MAILFRILRDRGMDTMTAMTAMTAKKMATPHRVWVGLIVAGWTLVPALAERPGFPVAGLEGQIAFWELVFTEYGGNDLIIHDIERVGLIYDVVEESSRRSGLTRIERLLDEVRRHIDDPDGLSEDGWRMYEKIQSAGVSMTAGDIAVLRGRIHIQRGVRERFRDGIVRSGRYLAHFEEVLESHGVPRLLALLPLVESSFENAAYSSAGAAGIWQFTRSTGREYMTISGRRDDRLDPVIATRAAARLLRGNYDALRSWPLATTAYNHGRAGMLRAQRAHGSDMAVIVTDYTSRTFGYASKNFYAEFIAAVNVFENYAIHFGPLALDSPLDFSEPALRMASTGPLDLDGSVEYRVRAGDTLSGIAARSGTSIGQLRALNRLPNDRIFAGETLIVGVEPQIATTAGIGEYHVRAGDTLSGIATAHSMTLGELRTVNRLTSDRIVAGTTLIVSGGPTPPAVVDAGEYEVRFGDTLGEIARRFGVELRELMELNGLGNTQIYAGQTLILR